MAYQTNVAIWVPAVILGNLIGVLIFLYAHEASTHQISGAFKRWFCGGGENKKKKGAAASSSSSPASASPSSKKEAAEAEPSSFQAPSSSSLRRKIPLQDSAHPSPYRPGSLAATPSRPNGSIGNGGGGGGTNNPLNSPGEFDRALGSAAAAAAAASSLRARPLPASYEADSFLSEGDEEEDEQRSRNGGGPSEAGSFDSADFEDDGGGDDDDDDDDDEAGLLSTAWVRSCACGGKGAAAVKGGPAGGSWCSCRVRWVPPSSAAAFSSSGALENGALLRASSPDASPPSFASNGGGDKKAAGSAKKSSRSSSARCPRPIEISWSNVTCNLTHVPPSSDPDDVAAAAIDEAAAAARNGGGSGSGSGNGDGAGLTGGKPVLGPNWGEVLPGEMCAIVGPSGAGKSTLLDVLAARKTVGVVGGTVSVGGRAVPASSHSRGGKGGGGGGSSNGTSSASAAALAEAALFFRKVAAYVPQEDAYVPTLTAAETLTFHARLRARRRGGIRGGDGGGDGGGDDESSSRAATCCLSGSSPASDPAAIAALVREGLSQVGLSRAGGTAVGGTLPLGLVVRGLSSGERRRLSVACALVGSPSLLLLDEPTTGLDAAAALAVTRRLASLARAGHTVIATIHQPREGIWRAFGKAVLLSEGRQIYGGVASGAAAWLGEGLGLGAYRPSRDGAEADWLLDCVNVNFSFVEEERPGGGGGGEKSAGEEASCSSAAVPGGHLRTRADAAAAAAAFAAAHPGPKLSFDSSDASEKAGNSSSSSSSCGGGGGAGGAVARFFSWPYASSFATQFRVLLGRSFRAQLRNPGDAASRTFVSSWVGLFGGLVFLGLGFGAEASSERYVAQVFIMLAYAMMPFGYISLYAADRAFYAADVAAGLYHPLAYYLASAAAAAPLLIVNTLCGAFAAYGLANLGPSPRQVLVFAGFLALEGLISAQLLVAATYVTPTQDMAYLVAIAYMSACLMLDGTYVRFSEMTGLQRALSNLSYLKFMLWGLLGNELDPVGAYPSRANGKPPCISRGALGATAKELNKLVDTPEARQRARLGGLKCEDVPDGHAALKVFMSEYVTAPAEAAAILVAFLAAMHVIAYVGARYMYKAQR